MPQDKKKILIVEDEAPELTILLQKVSQAGFTAVGAKNGQEAIDLANKEKPDLALLDLILPGMGGIDIVKALRADKHTMPIIILTNISEAEKEEEAKAAGANLYLVKTDWTLEQVIDKIKEQLDFN